CCLTIYDEYLRSTIYESPRKFVRQLSLASAPSALRERGSVQAGGMQAAPAFHQPAHSLSREQRGCELCGSCVKKCWDDSYTPSLASSGAASHAGKTCLKNVSD